MSGNEWNIWSLAQGPACGFQRPLVDKNPVFAGITSRNQLIILKYETQHVILTETDLVSCVGSDFRQPGSFTLFHFEFVKDIYLHV